MMSRRRREDPERGRPATEIEPGPPVEQSDTTAPARSAMSPAAATSQADRPWVWAKASKRPLAT